MFWFFFVEGFFGFRFSVQFMLLFLHSNCLLPQWLTKFYLKFSFSPCPSTWRSQRNGELPSLNSLPNFPFIIQVCDDGVENTKKQLLTVCPGLQDAQPQLLDKLLSVWTGVRDRLFKHYHFAAKAYFMYLRMGAEVKAT